MSLNVMLHSLGYDKKSASTFKNALNKIITEIKLQDDELYISFNDDSKIKIFDDGQSCCESRYMTTDDDLSYYVGSVLLDAEVVTVPEIDDDYYGSHEMQFLKVKTSKGVFTMESHNEHNGYYGGFAICIEQMRKPKPNK